jgi:glycosyltransferase involved in cell wall biosynthesis
MAATAMRIIQALPGRMRFEATGSNSIELCVAEWVARSRYRQSTTVLAEFGNTPPIDVDVYRRQSVKRFTGLHIAYTIRKLVKRRGYNLIVSQQHVSTAAAIALLNPGVPVILQTHNFIDPPERGPRGRLGNGVRRWEFGLLAGMTLISEATLRQFEMDWPYVTVPRRVITNGIDFCTWAPAAEREKTVLVVARTHETKGILEAAQGVRTFLKAFPDWRATFILSDHRSHPEYFAAVSETLRYCGIQAEVLSELAFAEVKRRTEVAAISVVASKWAEPFGRVALEAHAGGAALISSGTGALREISGDTALYLEAVTGPAIACALRRLASDGALRERLSREGMQRVRERFRLAAAVSEQELGIAPVCQRLDDFFRQTVVDANNYPDEANLM